MRTSPAQLATLHNDVVEVEIRTLALDPPVMPGLDLGEALFRFDTVFGLTFRDVLDRAD